MKIKIDRHNLFTFLLTIVSAYFLFKTDNYILNTVAVLLLISSFFFATNIITYDGLK